MIQIFYGDENHKSRCIALSGATPGSEVTSATSPAKKDPRVIDTLTFWGHGDSHHFCNLNASAFVSTVKDWKKMNPSIKTLEIITCNSRHGTTESKRQSDGKLEKSWVKSYTDQVKPGLRSLGLTVKALPMGMGDSGPHLWSILKFSDTTKTWMYITAGGALNDNAMWAAVNMVEDDPLFKATKNYVTAGTAVKARDKLRKYTIDFGTIGTLRAALITLA